MQIKLDQFLTLTAMLATTQVANMGCTVTVDNGDSEVGADEDRAEADDDQVGSGDRADDSSEMSESDVDLSSGRGSGLDAGVQSGAQDPGTPSQEQDEPPTPAEPDDGALGMTEGDAAVEGALPSGDAGLGDAGAEGQAPTMEPDAAAEGQLECYDAQGEVEDIDIETCDRFSACPLDNMFTCERIHGSLQPPAAEVWMQCYDEAAIGDPCSEEAIPRLFECKDLAVQTACPVDTMFCPGIVANQCNEVTLDECNASMSAYWLAHQDDAEACLDKFVTELGPHYDGCANTLRECINDPSFEF